jgi:hypothetical protein
MIAPGNKKSRKSVETVWGKVLHHLWLAITLPILPMTKAMTASPHPFTVRQMNETIALKINGDEFSHWITDTNGMYSKPLESCW